MSDTETKAVTAAALFERLQQQLKLTWHSGENGRDRALKVSDHQDLRPALAGFLNLVHPNEIQVLGPEELAHLDSLDARNAWETVADIMGRKPVALIVSDELMVPDDLAEAANESGTPLWGSALTAVDLVSHLQHDLSRALASSTTVHGVYMEVFSIGVLITGAPGCGKSELALELITRGHRLIADDAPLMTRIALDVVDGTCPPLLQDCLEVRGLGILNVRAMFGDSAIKPNKYLKLITHLELEDPAEYNALDRLHGEQSSQDVLGMAVPVTRIPVAPGRNIAVLVETAVRNHALKLRGFNAADEFLKRHDARMRQQAIDDQRS